MKTQSEVVKRYNYIVNEIDAFYHDAALTFQLSDSDFSILYTICERGDGCNQSDIYKLGCMSRKTINTAIHKLEKEGILYLEMGSGKNKRVFLTEEGKSVVRHKIQPFIKAENSVLASWTEEEREGLLRLTKKYLDDIKIRFYKI